uniref:(northern house mosquito) hypothetical protein n=1 Tax=Culex pipiens TaxID=7175 RepID=A0A8D8HEE1_CULPI
MHPPLVLQPPPLGHEPERARATLERPLPFVVPAQVHVVRRNLLEARRLRTALRAAVPGLGHVALLQVVEQIFPAVELQPADVALGGSLIWRRFAGLFLRFDDWLRWRWLKFWNVPLLLQRVRLIDRETHDRVLVQQVTVDYGLLWFSASLPALDNLQRV